MDKYVYHHPLRYRDVPTTQMLQTLCNAAAVAISSDETASCDVALDGRRARTSLYINPVLFHFARLLNRLSH
jgi:hypothetical protein